jgi:hypothetical protein
MKAPHFDQAGHDATTYAPFKLHHSLRAVPARRIVGNAYWGCLFYLQARTSFCTPSSISASPNAAKPSTRPWRDGVPSRKAERG